MELFKVDFGLTIWMFVAFAILFFILWKFAWPAIMKGIDSRADLIDKGVEYAQNAKEQLDSAQQQADAQIQAARHKEADIIAEANRMKSQIIEQARDEAKRRLRKRRTPPRWPSSRAAARPNRTSATRSAVWLSALPVRLPATSSPTRTPSAGLSTATLTKSKAKTDTKGHPIAFQYRNE